MHGRGILAGTAVNAGGVLDYVLVAPPGSIVAMLREAVISGQAIHPKVGTEHHGTSVATDARIIGHAAGTGGGAGGSLVAVRTRSQ